MQMLRFFNSNKLLLPSPRYEINFMDESESQVISGLRQAFAADGVLIYPKSATGNGKAK